MNVALIIGTVRTLAEFENDPGDILAGLNRPLVGRMQGGFTTAVVLKLDRSGHCTLVNAGHLSPFLNANEFALKESLPLGIIFEAEFVDQHSMLRERYCLTLYTDRVPEARGEKENSTDSIVRVTCFPAVPLLNPSPMCRATLARKTTLLYSP